MRIRVGVKKGDVVGRTNRELQMAADLLAAKGGGTLEIGPGVYTMEDALHLRSGVHVTGAGAKTVLKRAGGVSALAVDDPDLGQQKVKVKSTRGFKVGMGVTILDDKAGGYMTSVSRITKIDARKKVIYVADHHVFNYHLEHRARITNAASVISAKDVEDVVVENLTVDGNRRRNRETINGCVGGGIYLFKAKRCRIAGCKVKDFSGDGISFQITQDIVVEDCVVDGVSVLGIHPGTGSARPVVRRCKMMDCGADGLFLCWRVQEGLFEKCEVTGSGRWGISIGHKDSRNLFRGNTVRKSALSGIIFRNDPKRNTGNYNRFEKNLIEANGQKTASCAVEIRGETTGLEFTGNTIRPGRAAKKGAGQRLAFGVGPVADMPKTRRNKVARHRDGVTARITY